eukprot:TRINITY_DN7847_c0_g1_i1.p1 TRINITY_DN7847_c0_g1~~TRINITY_DN7847_c0_g1_i1.p1  ORF type:complete len:632 (-),score=97.89 TRINITY_DN7847_c0_g1_i1:169-2064(-)
MVDVEIAKKVAILSGLVGAALATSVYAYLRAHSDNVHRDLATLIGLVKVRRKLSAFQQKNQTFADLWEEVIVKTNARNVCLQFVSERPSKFTYEQVDQEANRVANWAQGQGLRPGDNVAIVMENCPEMIFCWIGLSKLGVTSALINYNLKGKPLVHSLVTSRARIVITGHNVIKHLDEVKSSTDLLDIQKWFVYDAPAHGYEYLGPLVSSCPAEYNREIRKGVRSLDDLLYVYTSGTTGLPKAAGITHLRYYMGSALFHQFLGYLPDDISYSPLPLYHFAAHVMMGSTWLAGITHTFCQKFSATRFWFDVASHHCTIIQYIGELCRYLLNTPPSPYDNAHKVRVAVGNGLRPDIWLQFKNRFNIPVISEFYSSTEGNIGVFNNVNHTGAVGFLTPLLQKFYPAKVIRFDVETGEIVRGPDGFCIAAKPNEAGELVGLVKESDPVSYFRGYTDSRATEKKIIRNVFKKGDCYFRTGDLMKIDEAGAVYFIDRIGDTFRWKGENVSTTEIAEVLGSHPDIAEANVYGVHIPRHEGRVGMALIIPRDSQKPIDLGSIYLHVKKNLPSYASPMFLRIGQQMEITSTFKHKKTDLIVEGFNPDTIGDPLYFRDDTQHRYVRLDRDLYHKIVTKANL